MAEMSKEFRNELRRVVEQAFPNATKEEIEGKTDYLMVQAVRIGKKLRNGRGSKKND